MVSHIMPPKNPTSAIETEQKGPHIISSTASHIVAEFIRLFSDFVFAGQRPPFRVRQIWDIPEPGDFGMVVEARFGRKSDDLICCQIDFDVFEYEQYGDRYVRRLALQAGEGIAREHSCELEELC